MKHYFEDYLNQKARSMIYTVVIDNIELCEFEFNGKKYHFESYPLAIEKCKEVLKEYDNKKEKRKMFLSRFLKFFKQLFCFHKYVIYDIIIPPEYHGRFEHYCLRCLKCGATYIYEKRKF